MPKTTKKKMNKNKRSRLKYNKPRPAKMAGPRRNQPLNSRRQIGFTPTNVQIRDKGSTKVVTREEVVATILTPEPGEQTTLKLELNNRVTEVFVAESEGWDEYEVLSAVAHYTKESSATTPGSLSMAWDSNVTDGQPSDRKEMSKYAGSKLDSFWSDFSVPLKRSGKILYTLNELTVESRKWTDEANLFMIASGATTGGILVGTVTLQVKMRFYRQEAHSTTTQVPALTSRFFPKVDFETDPNGNLETVLFDATAYNGLNIVPDAAGGKFECPPGVYSVELCMRYRNGFGVGSTAPTCWRSRTSVDGVTTETVDVDAPGSNTRDVSGETYIRTILEVGSTGANYAAAFGLITFALWDTASYLATSYLQFRLISSTASISPINHFLDSVPPPMSTRNYRDWRTAMYQRNMPVLPKHRLLWNRVAQSRGLAQVDTTVVDSPHWEKPPTKIDEMRVLLHAMEGIRDRKSAYEILPAGATYATLGPKPDEAKEPVAAATPAIEVEDIQSLTSTLDILKARAKLRALEDKSGEYEVVPHTR